MSHKKKKKKKKYCSRSAKVGFYQSHPYFNKDPSIEYAQFPVGIRYHNAFGGWYIKDRAHGKDDKDRDRYKEHDQRGSGRDPTPDRRSHSRDKVGDHRKRAGVSRDKKDGQDARDRRRESSSHPARDRSNNCECTQVDDDYSSVCALLDAAPVAIELTGQTIDCNLLQLLILRVTLAHLACMSMSCLTPERGRRTTSMKQRRLGFGRWVLNTRP